VIAVSIDGVIGGAEASLPVLDPGLLHGDLVFETLRAHRGAPIDVEPHLDRFVEGARALALEVPARPAIRAALDATVAAAGDPDLRVRVIATRAGRLIVTAEPCDALSSSPPAIVVAEVDRPLSDPRTLDPSLKTGNYLPSLLALRAARALGADDAIRLTPAGLVAEGASANLFAVIGGALLTPPASLGVRAGVTRARVMALAGDAVESALTPADLDAATEIFLTSSIRGVAAVRRVLSARGTIDHIAPGPRTRAVAAAYHQFATAVAPGAGR